jgi:trehalose 6-phosphate synthase
MPPGPEDGYAAATTDYQSPLRPRGVSLRQGPATPGAVLGPGGAAGDTRAVVAVVCKPPVTRVNGSWRTAPGGLAPIVRRVLERRSGAWVSWNGASTAPPRDPLGPDFEVLTFTLGRVDGENFYGGFANRTLWPLLHDAVAQSAFDAAWWPAYRRANDAFARAARVAARRQGDVRYWVHDYQLLLVPERLREHGESAPISFFLHTPFPSPAVFARLPQRAELIHGMSGADIVGFHTEGDRQRFLASFGEWGSAPAPATIVAPATIDVPAFQAAARNPETLRHAAALRRRLGNRIVLLSVERLDYTKGVLERLRALELLLERRRDLRRRLVHVQIAQPSRGNLPEYRRLRAKVEREIGRINGRFTVPGHDVPLRYLRRAVRDYRLVAYYLTADLALVTPLRDGMNLVAKEFVCAQAAAGRDGMLVLSEFAGAASELRDAMLCNPFDASALADVIEATLELDADERRSRMSAMARTVEAGDVDEWASLQLDRVVAPAGVERAAV